MSAIYVCPLSALSDVLIESRAVQMISLSGPGKSLETPAQIKGEHLKLEFNEINEPRDGLIAPAPEHMQRIIKFAKTWDQSRTLVIHCWMGISRSTAAAATILLALLPNTCPEAIAQLIREKSPMATPNPMMIGYADQLLKQDGNFISAVSKIGRGVDAFEGQPFSIALQDVSQ